MQKVSEHELAYRNGDSGVKYLIRGPRIDWGVMLLLPGQTLGGHYHREVEETFYIVEGMGTMVVNGEAMPAMAGDAFRLDPEDRHDLRNHSTRPMKVVFIKHPLLPEDKVDI
jgi:mannose-6-phosphate isomerase-like protein (cupin superfamily)